MNRSRAQRIAATAALLIIGAIFPGAAGADCNDGLLSCQTDAEQTEGAVVTLEAITTTLPLRTDPADPLVYGTAFGTYASMLQGNDLPSGEAPSVGLALRRTTAPTGEEVLESTVAIRVSRDGENGWAVVSRTLSSGAVDQRAVGVLAVDGQGTYSGDSATMATAAGAEVMSLSFADSDAAADEQQIAFTTRTDPTFGVTPLISGDTPWRITQAARAVVPLQDLASMNPAAVDGVTAVAAPSTGDVTYSVNPDLRMINGALPPVLSSTRSLADVIDIEGTVTGLSWTTDATLVEQADNTDDARGPLPVEPPAAPVLPSTMVVAAADPNNGGTVSYLNNDITIPRGTSFLMANFDATFPHPIVCSDGLTGSQRFRDQCEVDAKDITGDKPGGDKGGTVSVVHTENLQPGVYYFVCEIHSGSYIAGTQMSGRITVL